MAGWQLTSKGWQINFVDGTGAPYYPLNYRVMEIGQCVALIQIEGVTQRLTCMPNELAFTQPTNTAFSEPTGQL